MKKRDAALLTFGRNIRKRREAKDLSQEDLALLAGLDRTYVGGIERGERNATILSAIKIGQALGASVSELTQGIEK